MENVEETLKIEELSSPCIALNYGVAIYVRRINSDRKKVLFLKSFPREKFSKRRTYSLDPFYQHYVHGLHGHVHGLAKEYCPLNQGLTTCIYHRLYTLLASCGKKGRGWSPLYKLWNVGFCSLMSVDFVPIQH